MSIPEAEQGKLPEESTIAIESPLHCGPEPLKLAQASYATGLEPQTQTALALCRSLPRLTYTPCLYFLPPSEPHCFADLTLLSLSDRICFLLPGVWGHRQRPPLTTPGPWGPTLLQLAYLGFPVHRLQAKKREADYKHGLHLGG